MRVGCCCALWVVCCALDVTAARRRPAHTHPHTSPQRPPLCCAARQLLLTGDDAKVGLGLKRVEHLDDVLVAQPAQDLFICWGGWWWVVFLVGMVVLFLVVFLPHILINASGLRNNRHQDFINL